jgi:hypothetical protein
MPVMHPCENNAVLTSACEATKQKGYGYKNYPPIVYTL